MIYFGSKGDTLKANEETRRMNFASIGVSSNASSSGSSCSLEASVLLLDDEIVDDTKRLYHRPLDCDIDEFHPRASRILHVNRSSSSSSSSDSLPPPPVTTSDLREKFSSFGEILDIDVRKNGAYATVEFADVAAVAQAILANNASGGSNKMRLAFGRSPVSKCVWCSGLPDGVTVRSLQSEFGKFGKIQEIILDRWKKGTALIYFDQVSSTELRAKPHQHTTLKCHFTPQRLC